MSTEPANRKIDLYSAVGAVAYAVDGGSLDELMELHTADSTRIIPGRPFIKGREAIRDDFAKDRADGRSGPGSGSRHVVGSITITSFDGDTAQTRAYVLGVKDMAGVPTFVGTATYNDRYRFQEGSWRLAERRVEGLRLITELAEGYAE